MSRSSSKRTATRFPVAYAVLAGVIILLLVVGSLAVVLDPSDDPDNTGGVPTAPAGQQIGMLETTVAENPQDSRSIAVLADILANEGQLDEAVRRYQQAIDLEPENATYRVAFARALQNLGNDFDARVQYERAIELEPNNQSATFYYGFFLETLEEPDWEGSLEWFRRTIEIDETSVIANQATQRIAKIEQTLGTPVASPSASPAGSPEATETTP